MFERIKEESGLPEVLRVDNGPELISGEFVSWAESVGMRLQYIEVHMGGGIGFVHIQGSGRGKGDYILVDD